MSRSTSRWYAFLVLAVAVAACSADDGIGPGSTGAIRVTLTYQGSSVQDGVATVTLTGVNQTPKVTGNVFLFTGLAPGTYVAEPSGVPAGCLVVGARQDSVTVVAGNTAHATFAIRCSAGNQLLVVSRGDIAQGGHLFTSFAIVNADGTDFHELSRVYCHRWTPPGRPTGAGSRSTKISRRPTRRACGRSVPTAPTFRSSGLGATANLRWARVGRPMGRVWRSGLSSPRTCFGGLRVTSMW